MEWGQVDDVSADYIISQLLFLDAEDQEKDIKLFINSPGGSVTAGISMTLYYIYLLLVGFCHDTNCCHLQSYLCYTLH